eukprot:4934751-Pyramimonas_sp.AAC.1
MSDAAAAQVGGARGALTCQAMDGRAAVDFGSPRADDDFARRVKRLGARPPACRGARLDLTCFEWAPRGADEGVGALMEAPAAPTRRP